MNTMTQKFDTIIIGGGQAGLSTSYYLAKQGHSHLVLEQSDLPAPAWRERWDSFTLVTPNSLFLLPGAEYQGNDPDGFMRRDEVVETFQQYVKKFELPLRYNTRVTAVEKKSEGNGFRIHANGSEFEADNVVVATGLFQHPRRLPVADRLPADIAQLHSSEYRNPDQLPAGAVLVVGSSQSGCQIAQEIHKTGRTVYLCVGDAGRIPRCYRGKDAIAWANLAGFWDRTVDMLPSPKMKFAANPHVAGKKDEGSLNLHQFARDGMRLLGRLLDAEDGKIRLAPDLHENLAKADQCEADFVKGVDAYIAKNKLDIPVEHLPELKDGYNLDIVEQLDLKSEGVGTVIWAVGYTFDFSMVGLPVFDDDGYPVQQRGVTNYPGLYFVGLPWLYKYRSGFLGGVGGDAAHISSTILARNKELA